MKNSYISIVISAITMAALTVQALPKIDTSPDRNKTDINPGLTVIGSIKPRSTKQIDGSMFSVGCETVDRKCAASGSAIIVGGQDTNSPYLNFIQILLNSIPVSTCIESINFVAAISFSCLRSFHHFGQSSIRIYR